MNRLLNLVIILVASGVSVVAQAALPPPSVNLLPSIKNLLEAHQSKDPVKYFSALGELSYTLGLTTTSSPPPFVIYKNFASNPYLGSHVRFYYGKLFSYPPPLLPLDSTMGGKTAVANQAWKNAVKAQRTVAELTASYNKIIRDIRLRLLDAQEDLELSKESPSASDRATIDAALATINSHNYALFLELDKNEGNIKGTIDALAGSRADYLNLESTYNIQEVKDYLKKVWPEDLSYSDEESAQIVKDRWYDGSLTEQLHDLGDWQFATGNTDNIGLSQKLEKAHENWAFALREFRRLAESEKPMVSQAQFRQQGNIIQATETIVPPAPLPKATVQLNSTPQASSYEAQLVNAFTDFLVERFKEELTISFFQRLHEQIEKEKSQYGSLGSILTVLFPTTVNQLGLAAATYDYVGLLPALRLSFARDLQQLIFSTPSLLNALFYPIAPHNTDPKVTVIIDPILRDPALKNGIDYISVLIALLQPIADGTYPADVLLHSDFILNTKVPGSWSSIKAADPSLGPNLELLKVFSEQLRNPNDPERRWFTPDSFKQYFAANAKTGWSNIQPTLLDTLLPGVLYEHIVLRNPTSGSTIKEEDFQALLTGFIAVTQRVDKAYDSLRSRSVKEEILARHLTDYYRATFGLVDLTTQFLGSPTSLPRQQKFQSYNQKVLAIHYASLEGRFDVAALRLNELLNELIPIPPTQTPDNASNPLHQRANLVRYTNFMATMAQAKDAETMKTAIRGIALPSGSYTIKRRSIRSMSINAFVGVSGGLEYAGTITARKLAGNIAPAAPIGFALNWGGRIENRKEPAQSAVNKSKDRFLKGTSHSVFFGLIDLGTTVNARISAHNSSSQTLPEETLTQVFSPSIYYIFGFAKAPVSLFVGPQFTTDTRKIEGRLQPAYRLNLGVAVDIPLLHFGVRPRI